MRNYANSGHGGNRLLRERDPENFQFTILELRIAQGAQSGISAVYNKAAYRDAKRYDGLSTGLKSSSTRPSWPDSVLKELPTMLGAAAVQPSSDLKLRVALR